MHWTHDPQPLLAAWPRHRKILDAALAAGYLFWPLSAESWDYPNVVADWMVWAARHRHPPVMLSRSKGYVGFEVCWAYGAAGWGQLEAHGGGLPTYRHDEFLGLMARFRRGRFYSWRTPDEPDNVAGGLVDTVRMTLRVKHAADAGRVAVDYLVEHSAWLSPEREPWLDAYPGSLRGSTFKGLPWGESIIPLADGPRE